MLYPAMSQRSPIVAGTVWDLFLDRRMEMEEGGYKQNGKSDSLGHDFVRISGKVDYAGDTNGS